MNTTRVEIYRNKRFKFAWRVRAANGRIICSPGEDFVSKRNAIRSYHTVNAAMNGKPLLIVDLTEKQA